MEPCVALIDSNEPLEDVKGGEVGGGGQTEAVGVKHEDNYTN